MAPRTRTPKVLPPVDTRADDAIAQKLLAWARGRFGRAIADVFAWRSPVDPSKRHFALYGKAQNLSRALGFDGKVTNGYLWLDKSLASAFSLPVPRNDREPFLTQYSPAEDLGPYQILDTLEDVIARHVLHVDRHDVAVALITEPGYPYFGPGTVYYSAAAGRHYAAPTPPWEKRGEGMLRSGSLDHGVRPVADWCQLARRSPVTLGSINFSDNPRDPLFVTHSLGLGLGWRHAEAALEILRCQGLLFPSFAVGPIPASNYGPCSLFANAEIVRRELKPYRVRGQTGDAVLYATDAWTPVTGEIVSTLAAKFYDQLTGRAASAWFMYGTPHLYALGLPLTDDTSDVEGGAPLVTSVPDAARRLKRRFKIWHGPMNTAQFRRAMATVSRPGTLQNSADSAAFLEAKAHVIVPMGAFMLAVVPDAREGEYRQFLASIGYQGQIRVLALSSDERIAFSDNAGGKGSDAELEEAARVRYNYAWRVAAEAKLAMHEGNGVW